MYYFYGKINQGHIVCPLYGGVRTSESPLWEFLLYCKQQFLSSYVDMARGGPVSLASHG